MMSIMSIIKTMSSLTFKRNSLRLPMSYNRGDSLIQLFHTSVMKCKERDRRYFLQGTGKRDEGTEGEHLLGVDAAIKTREDMFPDEKTYNLLFNGIPFKNIPIIHIRVSKNNSIMHIVDAKANHLMMRSCGMEGFKNCRKGTNIAAQATAITLGKNALKAGICDVRLKIRGLGPGRMASIKGFVMAGMNIISITDCTPAPFGRMPRPRKIRRV